MLPSSSLVPIQCSLLYALLSKPPNWECLHSWHSEGVSLPPKSWVLGLHLTPLPIRVASPDTDSPSPTPTAAARLCPVPGPRVSWGPQLCSGHTLSPLTCLPSLVGMPSPQSMASAWSVWQSVGAWGPLGPGWAVGWRPLPPRLHAIVWGLVSRRVTCSRCPGCVPLPSLAVRSWTPAVGLSLHESHTDAVASTLLFSSLLAQSSGQDCRLCRLGAARAPLAPQHLVLHPPFSVFMDSLLSLEHEKSSLEVRTCSVWPHGDCRAIC